MYSKISYLFTFKIIYSLSKQNDREWVISHFLMYSPNSHKNQCWTRPKPGTRASLRWQGIKHLGHPLLLSLSLWKEVESETEQLRHELMFIQGNQAMAFINCVLTPTPRGHFIERIWASTYFWFPLRVLNTKRSPGLLKSNVQCARKWSDIMTHLTLQLL